MIAILFASYIGRRNVSAAVWPAKGSFATENRGDLCFAISLIVY